MTRWYFFCGILIILCLSGRAYANEESEQTGEATQCLDPSAAAEFENQLKAAQAETKTLSQKFQEAESAKEGLAAELEKAKGSYAIESKQLKEQLAAVEKLKIAVKAKDKELKDANGKAEALVAELEQTKGGFETESKKVQEQHRAAVEKLEAELKAKEKELKEAVENLEAELKAKEKELKDAKDHLVAASSSADEVKKLEETVRQLSNTLEEKSSLLAQVEAEKKSSSASVQDLSAQLENEKKQVASLQEKLAKLEKKVSECENPEPVFSVFMDDVLEGCVWFYKETIVQVQILLEWVKSASAPAVAQVQQVTGQVWEQAKVLLGKAWEPIKPHYIKHAKPIVDDITAKLTKLFNDHILVHKLTVLQTYTAVKATIMEVYEMVVQQASASYKTAVVFLQTDEHLPDFVKKNAAWLMRTTLLVVAIMLMWYFGLAFVRLLLNLTFFLLKMMLKLLLFPFVLLKWMLLSPFALFRGKPKAKTKKIQSKPKSKPASKPQKTMNGVAEERTETNQTKKKKQKKKKKSQKDGQ